MTYASVRLNGALLTKALLFGLLSTACAFAVPQDSSHPADAQEPAKSLGEIAKEAKKNKPARAKTVITDENLDVPKGPLPKLNLEGPENFDEILLAISSYKAKHTSEETEQTLYDWYHEYDAMLAAIFKENVEFQSLRDSNTYYSSEKCGQGGDYRKCMQRQNAEARGLRQDRSVMKDNWQVANRIQTGIMRVGEGLGRYNIHYDWWKVRYINSNF